MKKHLSVLILALLLMAAFSGLSEDLDLPMLRPIAVTLPQEAQSLPLQSGPTGVFLPLTGASLNPQEPFVIFGTNDSWIMAAQGTPDRFGPVGFVQWSALSVPANTPSLETDPLPAMLEEAAALSASPQGEGMITALPQGQSLLLLFTFGDAVYVQTELTDGPVQGFLPLSAVL